MVRCVRGKGLTGGHQQIVTFVTVDIGTPPCLAKNLYFENQCRRKLLHSPRPDLGQSLEL